MWIVNYHAVYHVVNKFAYLFTMDVGAAEWEIFRTIAHGNVIFNFAHRIPPAFDKINLKVRVTRVNALAACFVTQVIN